MRPFYDTDRSGGSSSASSAGTGSSTGGGPGNPAGGGRMAVIGVTRNVRLRRRGNAGFGFSLRGGREYAAGFYVSDVQPGGEAHRNGLRVLISNHYLFFSFVERSCIEIHAASSLLLHSLNIHVRVFQAFVHHDLFFFNYKHLRSITVEFVVSNST